MSYLQEFLKRQAEEQESAFNRVSGGGGAQDNTNATTYGEALKTFDLDTAVDDMRNQAINKAVSRTQELQVGKDGIPIPRSGNTIDFGKGDVLGITQAGNQIDKARDSQTDASIKFSNGGTGYIDLAPTPETRQGEDLDRAYDEKYGRPNTAVGSDMKRAFIKQGGVFSNSQASQVVGTEKVRGLASVEDIYNAYAQGGNEALSQLSDRVRENLKATSSPNFGSQINADSDMRAKYPISNYQNPPKKQLLPAVKPKK